VGYVFSSINRDHGTYNMLFLVDSIRNNVPFAFLWSYSLDHKMKRFFVPKTKICYTQHVLTLESSTKTFCYEAYHVETSIQLFQETKNSEALKTIPRYQSLLLITILVRFFF
jgi:hypothetical protein